MKRDTLKTLAGLIIIGIIVVATFLYGDAQRQAQMRRDQDLKKQEDAKVAVGSTAPSQAPKPSASAKPGVAANNTAPVQTPGASNIQGGGASTTAPTAKPAATPSKSPTPSPSVTPGVVAGAGTTANNKTLPDTGAPVGALFVTTAMATLAVAVRRSKRALKDAARSARR